MYYCEQFSLVLSEIPSTLSRNNFTTVKRNILHLNIQKNSSTELNTTIKRITNQNSLS